MIDTNPISCEEAADRAAPFVLGVLGPAEAAEVHAHRQACDQPHPEFAQLGGVVGYLAQLPEPVEPPAALRERIAAIATSAQEAALDGAEPRQIGLAPSRTAHGRGAGPQPAPPVPIGRRLWPQVQRWALPAAAVLIIGVLAGWNLLLQGQAAAADQRAVLIRRFVTAMNEPGALIARIEGTAGAPQASGLAVLPPERSGYLLMEGLERAPAGKTYQAWFMADGQPRSAGLVRVDADGLAVLAGLETADPVDQIAITVEAEGGAELPTSEPVAVGSVGL
ncbi:MAG: anti-sigma factor [Chloroflexi bacterium]|nr:anti-sigma factor [Chloroflexota bacterium]